MTYVFESGSFKKRVSFKNVNEFDSVIDLYMFLEGLLGTRHHVLERAAYWKALGAS